MSAQEVENIPVVVQLDDTGCALACVAMLTGHTYEAVKEAALGMGISVADERLYAGTDYMRKLLVHFGVLAAPGEAPFRTWEALPNHALLAIKWHTVNDQPRWHWVVFVRAKRPTILDPAASLDTNVRTDLDVMHPKWYIEVLPNSSD